MRVFGWLILAGLVVALMAFGGSDFRCFIDIPFAVFVLGVVVGGLWAAYGPLQVLRVVGRVVKGQPLDAKRVRVDLAVFQLGYQLSWGAGIIGMLIELVKTLATMDDPAAIGPGIAMSMIGVLYGASLAEFVFGPLQHSCISRGVGTSNEDDLPATGSLARGALACAVVFFVLGLFFVLAATWSPPPSDLVEGLRDHLQDFPQ